MADATGDHERRPTRKTRAAAARATAPQVPFIEIHKDAPGSLEDMKLGFTRRVFFLARRWRNAINDGLRHIGQSHARWITLTWIKLLDGRTNHSELAERVGVELPTLIRLLNRLEAEGLLERVALADGRTRAKSVRLTPQGQAVLDEMTRITDEVRAEFLKDVDAAQLADCMALLDQLLERSAGA